MLVKLQIVLRHTLTHCSTHPRILWQKFQLLAVLLLQVPTLHVHLNKVKDITLPRSLAEVFGFVFKYKVMAHCTSHIQQLCPIRS